MQISQAVVLRDGRTVRGRFDALTVAIHWLSAALVLLLLASGWVMTRLDALPLMPDLLLYHRSAGVLVWGLTVLRFAWRRSFATFPPFPANMWRITRWAAQSNEYAFYALLILQPFTGLIQMLLRGHPFEMFIWTVPALMTRNMAFADRVYALHQMGALALAGLVGVHAAAALSHHYLFRDDVLELMVPILRRRVPLPDLRSQIFAPRT